MTATRATGRAVSGVFAFALIAAAYTVSPA